MPSPLAHAAAGFAVARVLNFRKKNKSVEKQPKLNKELVLAAILLSLLPDFDSIIGIILRDFGRYHNNFSHSIAFGVIASLVIGLVVRAFKGQFRYGFSLSLVFYLIHILMDFFTWGRGIMLFWPLTEHRFSPGFFLFYGFHWSDGLLSYKHLITFLNELVFAAVLFGLLNRFLRSQHSSKIQFRQNPDLEG